MVTEPLSYPDLVNYLANLWLKAHVQHSVSFIQHEISATTEICLSCLKEVDEPSWSSDADLHTFNRRVIVRTKLLKRQYFDKCLTPPKKLQYLFPGHGSGVLWVLLRRYRWTWGEKLCHILQPPVAPAVPAHESELTPSTVEGEIAFFQWVTQLHT